MKIDPRRVASFLQAPGPVRVVLLHGDDEGMVRHRADAITLGVVGQRDDPFRVTWLAREDHGRLLEEATALAMLGGRRVIRVRDAGEALAPALQRVVDVGGESIVVVETAALPSRSKLRALVEAMPEGVAIACYPEEGKALQDAIVAGLSAAGVKVSSDGLAWLLNHAGADRGATRGEIAKLALFADAGEALSLDAVRTCVGDGAEVSFDDALDATTAGDIASADIAIERSLANGMAPVAITRGVLAHFGKLLAAHGHRASGLSATEAIKLLRPPVFFRRAGPMAQALSVWSAPRLMAAMAEARRVEQACKQTGAPDGLLVRRLFSALARQAAAARGGARSSFNASAR